MMVYIFYRIFNHAIMIGLLLCEYCYIMEDERKKFLLCRIKREQSLIISEFQKYKRVYLSREITPDKNQSFIQQITYTMQINNSLVSSLYEYLDKTQMQTAFSRINTIFNDLIDKYRKCTTQLTFMHGGTNVKQIREICDACHEKIENSRIENIRRGLEADSECRAAVIKKLIDDSEIERTRPLFTQQEDKQFKRQLQKVFKNKLLVLQTNIHETNVFLTTVQQEMAEFMVSFRKDFAEWGGQQIQQQDQNWGKLMKSYINKKLTNSFNNKIPNWIKKMHELFVDKQPIKPKQYFMNKQCQVGIPTQTQQKLSQQLEELNHSLIMKREALKQKQRQLQYEKIKSKALKTQLQSMQIYYNDKLYAKGKDQNSKQKIAKIQEIFGSDNARNSLVNLRDSNQGEKIDANQRKIISRANKNKKKFAEIAYQKMMQKSPQERKESQTKRQQKSRKTSLITDSKSENPLDIKSQKPNNNSNQKLVMNSFEQKNSYIDQGIQKLKKKAYNREKREEMLIEHNKVKNNHSASYQENKQSGKQSLNDKVTMPVDEISKDLKQKKASKQKNNGRLNSFSITQDQSLLHISEGLKNASVVIPNSNEDLKVDQNNKRTVHTNQNSNIEINKSEFNQLIDNLVQVSKCEDLVTSNDKMRLGKMIQKFLSNLESKNLKSLYYQPIKMSKVILSQHKENVPLLPFKDHGYSIVNRSLKKQYKVKDEQVQRKNKSLHTRILKLPAISIKNYNLRQTEQHSTIKDDLYLFINQTNAQQFQESFDFSKERNILKPTPSQLQEIQKIFSQLQLLKRQKNTVYIQLCNFMRYPFSSSKEKSPLLHLSYGFTFPSFFNFFLKVLWLHRQCCIQQGNKFCCHINGLQRKLVSFLPERKQDTIQRTDRLQIFNGIN